MWSELQARVRANWFDRNCSPPSFFFLCVRMRMRMCMCVSVGVCVCVFVVYLCTLRDMCVGVCICFFFLTIKDGVEEAGKISDYAHCVYMYMKHGEGQGLGPTAWHEHGTSR